MKEATGELNMTVITVVSIAAIAAFFYAFVWPNLKVGIANNQCESQCGEGNYEKADRKSVDNYTCTCKSTGYGSKTSNQQ